VTDGKISVGYAERQYGVVITDDPLEINIDKTRDLRAQFRQEGKPDPLSHVVEFEKALGVDGLVDRTGNVT
jgi:hypothetical protein